jgi:hypothetical protein
MKIWDKVKSIFSVSIRPKDASPSFETQRSDDRENCGDKSGRESNEEDPYRTLSEVAAPEPVRRCSPEELARRPSLERRLSELRSSDNVDDDIYESLSELAAPEPIERLSAIDIARRPSLEQRLS